MKKLAILVVAIVAVLAILAGVIASQSGTIIRHAVEEFGPEITGTKVALGDVNVSLLSGAASIKNLVIGNPQGFKSDSAIKVGEVAVLLDVKSLFSDRIAVKKILVEGAELTYELGSGGSNISVLQKNIEQRTASMGATESSTEAQSEGSATQLTIDDVMINGTRVNLVSSLLGGKGTSAQLPDIHLQDIGKEEGGASPAEAAKKVFAAITKAVTANVAKVLPTDQIKGQVDEAVQDKLKDVQGKLKGLLSRD